MLKTLMLFILAVALAACSNNGSSSSTTAGDETTIAGSTAMLPLVKQAAQDYQAAHPDVKIGVSGGGSRVGLTQAQQKGVTIGDSDIAPGPDQKDLVDHKVAVVTFAVVANPAAGVKSLTKKQIADIFSGKITNWSQAGGKDLKITVINRARSSGTRAVFVSAIMNNVQPTNNSLTDDSSGTVVTTTTQTPGAVTYVATSYLKDKNVVAIAIDGTSPSDSDVESGKYPFWSYEHMVTSGAPSKPAADFIDYVAKDKALLKQLGFLPVNAIKTK
ncbi:MAG: phosphate ABC transporter substrate-binding protein PstS family protein [Candidatus Eremiobacteraeota bacterium]|nr:phosphate ABC transporter substrate-binding protein PstS family protein [Candidatus Eremiobacteraeota bacterium]